MISDQHMSAGHPEATDPDAISRAAARWMILLDDDPDDISLREQVTTWLAQDPRHQQAFDDLRALDDAMGALPPRHADHWAHGKAPSPATTVKSLADHRHRPSRQIPQPSSFMRGRRLGAGLGVAIAASLLLMVASSAGFGVDRWTADVATGTGDLKTVALRDGSHVRLGPQSALDIAMTDTDRHVSLRSGQGFFDITHDPAHPFTVSAGDATITVLGTAFEVDRSGSSLRVAVRRGSVAVACVPNANTAAPSTGASPLLAGDWMDVSCADATARRGHGSANDVASWSDGQIIADNEPVGDVVNRLRPYVSGLILLHSERLAAARITGVYNTADPQEALQAVTSVQGGRVRHITPWVTILEDDPAQDGQPEL